MRLKLIVQGSARRAVQRERFVATPSHDAELRKRILEGLRLIIRGLSPPSEPLWLFVFRSLNWLCPHFRPAPGHNQIPEINLRRRTYELELELRYRRS